ncbi:hypothetical protein PHSY_002605 [Pseudozyma hubeiensis SY62]|uniref:Uncharacterized protein n=1 Tax=Pseudozyma hubeiensis (strain SY62) TaxID=1305764 RepID=R9PAA9_PSEHS|nr:hypothetical protein PHSY_002605 [Pseudozyma hubeiensis SY62]GAC95030.1 hypothetical protein PHSY_002605 [Pseudozyma hubeiensis SY62]
MLFGDLHSGLSLIDDLLCSAVCGMPNWISRDTRMVDAARYVTSPVDNRRLAEKPLNVLLVLRSLRLCASVRLLVARCVPIEWQEVPCSTDPVASFSGIDHALHEGQFFLS